MGRNWQKRFVVLTLLVLTALGGTACSKRSRPEAIEATPAPTNAANQRPAAGADRFVVDPAGQVEVDIDAPLEKFKGETSKLGGGLDVDPVDLTHSGGEVFADLDAFTSHTFSDKAKNEAQTEHARNWFGLGKDVDPKMREDYRMVRFTFQVEKAETPEGAPVKSLAEVPETDGKRTVILTTTGYLRIHGRAAKKTVRVEVVFDGPPKAPTSLTFRTRSPLMASLAEHDVKPRDAAGKFIAGALEKIGQKLNDRAIIVVTGSAHR